MVERSLRKIQLFRFTKQLRIYRCQSAIAALPPFIIHSVMTVFRRLWSFHATPVRLSTHTLNLANVIGVQCDCSTVCTKICPCVFWNSNMFFSVILVLPIFWNRFYYFFFISFPQHWRGTEHASSPIPQLHVFSTLNSKPHNSQKNTSPWFISWHIAMNNLLF